ncbi:HupU protein [Crenobacter caeni]|uniref:hydrogenase (acceptor) n=1 Tax=Crenobacter caeni TaxID=2705474 RepID=A0A6B2KUR0_9NEIS|nr:HupU protein [Crenobacter caeni]NDV13972.1 HupU protein [Crenobacter caeni]
MASNNKTLLWLHSGGCGGCTMSLLCAEAPGFFDALQLAGIDLLWHPSLSQASGDDALALFDALASGERALDILCVEGSVMTGADGAYHLLPDGRPYSRLIEAIARRAQTVIAVGTCAAYGGISAAGDNLGGATGLAFDSSLPGGLLGADFAARAGLPVVNIAGCPTHPDWVLETLALVARGELAATDLDRLGRPRFYADRLVHHGCARNEYYEFKASAEAPGQAGCLMEYAGCKGTQAHADCNTRPWNGAGSCIDGGHACVNCTSPHFADPGHPFQSTPKIAGFPVGLPTDMPKAWFVALATLSKSATPARVRANATADRERVAPSISGRVKP